MKAPELPSLRKQILDLLNNDGAHVSFEAAIRDLPPKLRGQRPPGGGHSPWELVEHMRIAQWDILEFIRNPKHVSPDFPAGYWPKEQAPPSAEDWDKSVKAYRADHRSISEMVADESIGLLEPLPHGDGQPILQKVLLVADHSAYHLGQLVLVRRFLGAWP